MSPNTWMMRTVYFQKLDILARLDAVYLTHPHPPSGALKALKASPALDNEEVDEDILVEAPDEK